LGKPLNNRTQLNGDFALNRTATDLPSILGFLDKSHVWGVTSTANLTRRLG